MSSDPYRLHPESFAGTTTLPARDEVLFDADGVRVTTERVVVRGRTWGLEHVPLASALRQVLRQQRGTDAARGDAS